jgi:GxxExxY protein
MQDESLTQSIIGCAMRVHNVLGPGFLESVYHRALVHELTKSGIAIESQKTLTVTYDGIVVGDFVADLLVESRVLIELKANQSLVVSNEVQLVNYLTAMGLDLGLLLNFGADRLEFKRKTRLLKPRS